MRAFIMWLNPMAGKMRKILCFDWLPEQILPARDFPRQSRKKKLSFRHIINLLLINRLARSRWLDISHFLFYAFIDLDFVLEEE